ncbi:iron chelate uptake ABC transporter family permease subunit, partial [Streptomyces sp. NPDC005047]
MLACGGLTALLFASVVVAIGLGPAVITPGETARHLWAALSGGGIGRDEVTTYQIIWQIRTPRVLLAALVGAGLSAVGVAIQALVRNALADPFVLGVSSGASVGAVAVTPAVLEDGDQDAVGGAHRQQVQHDRGERDR